MPTILIVDDDSVDRELAGRCLRRLHDIEILEAKDGTEALEIVSSRSPDLVVTDLRMPRIGGLELIGKVREDHPLVPVILMTSRGSEKIAVEALKAGAASYVPKTDLKADLADTVEQVLEVTESRRSRREILRYLTGRETRFDLVSDPSLIPPFVAYLQEGLERIDFADDWVRTQVGMALIEALSNAVIHGNLEVSSDLRDSEKGEYQEMIEQRRRQEPYSGRRVLCNCIESPEKIEYRILDEGPGFNPSTVPDPTTAENVLRVRGRGLMLIRTFMDDVRHNDKGNQITLTKLARDADAA